ncbi:MAG: ATP-binding protein [Pseudomonadota bacterium]
MSDGPIFTGFGVKNRLALGIKWIGYRWRLSKEVRAALERAERLQVRVIELGLDDDPHWLVQLIAKNILASFDVAEGEAEQVPLYEPLIRSVRSLLVREGYLNLPRGITGSEPPLRSEVWAIEDQLRRTNRILDDLPACVDLITAWYATSLTPLIEQFPTLFTPTSDENTDISFEATLLDLLQQGREFAQQLIMAAHAPELEKFDLALATSTQLAYNLELELGLKQPFDALELDRALGRSRASNADLIERLLGKTTFAPLIQAPVPITLPARTRFEHHHIVAGTGHGKTQMLQNLILHDLEQVAKGQASIVVIDSQADLIKNIAGLDMFAKGQPLHDRLCVIDPSDIEWPVALNLFDVGQQRLEGYSQLERERLTNGILELYDFVLGSLLDAGMTQKQAVIFRYITRLLLRIPNATIHTLRELLEDDGYAKYEDFIEQLEGSAKAFFTDEFQGKEFQSTKKQVLRRLYGILENQTFERMFSHPKSKLDLFSEMNAGKVILINTAKDLLKENGTQILGRFFIAMIAQAAQERAVLASDQRLPTIIYVDEAQDYFDRNIGIILSQTRKYNVGLVLAHQYLGQLDGKLQEAIFANTSIKFAGGVSAKDARTLSADFQTDPSLIESQSKLSFAAFVKGTTKTAASIAINYGEMEALPRLDADAQATQRATMRERYAIHYTEANEAASRSAADYNPKDDPEPPEPTEDTADEEEWWDGEDDDNGEQPWEKWGDFRDEELPEHPNDKSKGKKKPRQTRNPKK